jgi:hypothetical protein
LQIIGKLLKGQDIGTFNLAIESVVSNGSNFAESVLSIFPEVESSFFKPLHNFKTFDGGIGVFIDLKPNVGLVKSFSWL